MMEVLTPAQKVLTSYLAATGMPLVDRLLVTGMLWEEDATIEMLLYISRTREKDPDKLYAVAEEISIKYPSIEEDYYEDD